MSKLVIDPLYIISRKYCNRQLSNTEAISTLDLPLAIKEDLILNYLQDKLESADSLQYGIPNDIMKSKLFYRHYEILNTDLFFILMNWKVESGKKECFFAIKFAYWTRERDENNRLCLNCMLHTNFEDANLTEHYDILNNYEIFEKLIHNQHNWCSNCYITALFSIRDIRGLRRPKDIYFLFDSC